MVVYAAHRKETATQYIVVAQKLEVAVIHYMMNDNKVPKKYRYMLAQGAIHIACNILDCATAANKTFPNTPEKLDERKRFINKALILCYQLQARLLCMKESIENVTITNLRVIMELLVDEIELLSKALKNARLVGGKEV